MLPPALFMGVKDVKCVKLNYLGKEYYLSFNSAAMLAVQDLYPNENIVEILQDIKGSMDKIAKIVAIMSEQGELVRRYLGYEPREMLAEENINLLLTRPVDLMALRKAAMLAFAVGYGKEIEDENEVIDLGLQELNKKKARAD